MLYSKRMADISVDVNLRNLSCTTDEAHERGDRGQTSPEAQTSGCSEINDVSIFLQISWGTTELSTLSEAAPLFSH